jgi:hypothetical protein
MIRKQTEGIVERTIEDELLIIDELEDTIFSLNPLGAAVWRLLDTPATVEEIVHVLTTAFPDQARERISEDVESLVQSLKNSGLVSTDRD